MLTIAEYIFHPHDPLSPMRALFPEEPEFASWSNVQAARNRNAGLCSAVLVLLTSRDSEAEILLEVRSANLRHHAGDVAFPGGKLEDGDQTIADTALRETREEIGIPPGAVELWGTLPTVRTTVGNVLIYPVVGATRSQGIGQIHLNHNEVEHLLILPLCRLFRHSPPVREPLPPGRGDAEGTRPVYPLPDGYTLWGASARIVYSLHQKIVTGEQS